MSEPDSLSDPEPRPQAAHDAWRAARRPFHLAYRQGDRAEGRCGVSHARAQGRVRGLLPTHQRDTLALQSLLGHRSGNTTQIYLRKLDRQAEMERVRDLSWGVSVGSDEERTDHEVRLQGRGDVPVLSDDRGAQDDEVAVASPGDAVGSGNSQIDRERDAAVAQMFDTFPELQSTNVELLRLLLGYAWTKGYSSYTAEKARALEAELILRGAEL